MGWIYVAVVGVAVVLGLIAVSPLFLGAKPSREEEKREFETIMKGRQG